MIQGLLTDTMPGIGASPVLPFRDGERMSHAEFLYRYEAMPNVRAELIQGAVRVASPISLDHVEPVDRIAFALKTYAVGRTGTAVHTSVSVYLDDKNEYHPDVQLRNLKDGSTMEFLRTSRDGTAKRYLRGGPELIVEVAASTASYDLQGKKQVYHGNRVQEYLVWLVASNRIVWHDWKPEGYLERGPDADGVHRSGVFPGLWLDLAALIAGDEKRVHEVVRMGLASLGDPTV